MSSVFAADTPASAATTVVAMAASNLAIMAAQLLQRLQLRLASRRQRIAVDVQQHRDGAVPAHPVDQLDDAAFAEHALRRGERRIGDLPGLEQLGGEVVD